MKFTFWEQLEKDSKRMTKLKKKYRHYKPEARELYDYD